ncbi:hypothetical protein KH141_10225, partial [butyrate-producing bacterium]|nr:hypothetical protein [butyrate-producing bacterium]
PFQISFADGIFAFQPMFSYGQRSKCADLLNSYQISIIYAGRDSRLYEYAVYIKLQGKYQEKF